MILFNEPGHGQLIATAAGCSFDPEKDVVITRNGNREVLGGVIYQGYTGASVRLHVAGFTPHWGSIDMLWVCFDYPFNQLDCKKLIGFVPSFNEEALAFDYKLGFKYLTRIPGVYPGGDLIILEMSREDCKWLGLRPRSLQRTIDGRLDLCTQGS